MQSVSEIRRSGSPGPVDTPADHDLCSLNAYFHKVSGSIWKVTRLKTRRRMNHLAVVRQLLALAFVGGTLLRAGLPIVVAAEKSSVQSDTGLSNASQALKLGDFKQASVLFEQALKDREIPKETQWKIMKGLGESYMGAGDYKHAANMLKKALAVAAKECGGDSSEASSVRDSYAWALQAVGDIAGAKQQCAQTLQDRIKKLPAQPAEIADSYEHVGYLDETSRIWNAALENYGKALEIRRTSPGQNVLLADIIERLAYVTFMTGKQDAAGELYRQALSAKESQGEVQKQFSPQAVEERIVFRSLQGAPNCMRGMRDGYSIENISANGMSVDASLAPERDEFSNTVVARVRFSNKSSVPVQVLGERASVVTLKPQIRRLNSIEVAELAAKVERTGGRKAKLIRFFGEDATTPITTTAWGYGPPSFGYLPPAYSGAPPVVWNGRRGSNWSSQTVTTYVPDYQAREEARRKAAAVEAKSSQKAEDLRREALGTMTIQPGDTVDGVLEFEPAKFREALLRIPVGNAYFEFLFD